MIHTLKALPLRFLPKAKAVVSVALLGFLVACSGSNDTSLNASAADDSTTEQETQESQESQESDSNTATPDLVDPAEDSSVITDGEASSATDVAEESTVEIAPILPAIFPPANAESDCLFTTDNSGAVYCYSSTNRTLRAWMQDGNDWWGFSLPGEDNTNQVRSINVVGDQLIISARLNSFNEIDRSFEISAFTRGGEFQYSVPILQAIRGADGSHAFDIDAAESYNNSLLIAGSYGTLVNEPNWPTTPGAYLASVDVSSGDSLVSKRYEGLRLEGENQLNNTTDGLFITLSEINWLLDESTFNLSEVRDQNADNRITVDNYNLQKTRFLNQISNPPIDLLVNTALDWFNLEFNPTVNPDDFTLSDCPGGGTVRFTEQLNGDQGNTRNFTFDNCISNRFTLNGLLITYDDNFCGRSCSGPTIRTTMVNFSAAFTNGDSWLVDVERETETRIFCSETCSLPADFATTTITQFERHDARGSLIIGPGMYESSEATGGDIILQSWAGNSMMTFHTGLVENTQIDLRIMDGDDNEYTATGRLDASRSDGSSLTITPTSDRMFLVDVNTGSTAEQFVSAW